MPWIKKGLVFSPDKRIPWMQSHAQLPTTDHVADDIYRIYFSSRDRDQRSSIGYIEIDITNPKEIRNVSRRPVLTCGGIGCFDEHGVLPGSVVTFRGKKFLFYTGWHRGEHPGMFYYAIGLAVSKDGGRHFSRYSHAPLMSVSEHDPCLVASPFVFIEKDIWKMFYVSGFKWEKNTQGLRSHYHVKYAYSRDGIHWIRTGDVALGFKDKNERNIARTWIMKKGHQYLAWYCYASLRRKYRIGYGESTDGIHFKRKDALTKIDLSGHGFDNEMMGYPCVFEHKARRYMFYNGNHYGKNGFGLAIFEPDKGV